MIWFLFALIASAQADFGWEDWTVLDDYVHRDDGAFNFFQVAELTYNNTNCTTYVFNMTSQYYQDETKVDKYIWWHWVGVSIPSNLEHPDFAAMLIDGGSNREGATPPSEDGLENVGTCLVAEATGTIVGYVKQVPNQPVTFANDPTQRPRSEDSYIAWTWRTYIDQLIAGDPEADPEVLARMAMTKSAKRGMDTIAAVAAEKVGAEIDSFFITGASKRGWTTYSIAATDQRVKIIAPIVFSLLNVPETIMAHYRSMDGGYSFALSPYFNENLTYHLLDDDLIGPVLEVEDLFSYRRRFDGLPMLQIVATGDEFFLCTDSHYWWDQFPAKKWMMMNQNAEHALIPAYVRIAETIVGFVAGYLQGWEPPTTSWTMTEEEGVSRLVMTTSPPALNVTGWKSVTNVNNTRRDWRLVEGYPDPQLHPVWWYRDIDVVEEEDEETGTYTAEVMADENPDEWTGYFIQGQWEGPTGLRFFLTSEVNVAPWGTYPREPCDSNEECAGKLV
jgi:PhoPQ-activated pathogenicity-related protein